MIYQAKKRDGRAFSADVNVSEWLGGNEPGGASRVFRVGVWLEDARTNPTFYFRLVGELVENVSSDGSYLMFDQGQRVRFVRDYPLPGPFGPVPDVLVGSMGTIYGEDPGWGHLMRDNMGGEYEAPRETQVHVDEGPIRMYLFEGDDVAPPFEQVSEHALTLKGLMGGGQPIVRSRARLAPRIDVTITEETRNQMLVWWDEHGAGKE